MKEGSPPQPISFFINIPAAGKDPTSCQRARQQARFCDRQGNKTTKRMMYDLFADFYEKSSDSQPKYTVLMGSYYPKTINEMEKLGFSVDPDSTPGFVDYVKEVKEDELQDWVQDGDPVTVPCPSLADMLGDKLTAFAPHTTGIPFFKHEDPFFMEIMKQLYDVSSILDRIDDLSAVRKTYAEIVPIELGYRKLDQLTPADVLNDSYQCAMNICLRGALDRTEFSYYADGARRVNSFIISESYNSDVAIRDAAKVAYLVRLIQTGTNEVKHYSPEMDAELAAALIEDQTLNKLNRIKKISLEAFFYCRELELLAQ